MVSSRRPIIVCEKRSTSNPTGTSTITSLPASNRLRRIIQTGLILGAIGFCTSSLWSLSSVNTEPSWSQQQSEIMGETIDWLRSIFDLDQRPIAPHDSLCWPETRNLPPRTRLGVSADEAFKLDSLCLSHYAATLVAYIEASGMGPVPRSLYRSLSNSWISTPFRQASQIPDHPVPKIIYHPDLSPSHKTWSNLNPDHYLPIDSISSQSGILLQVGSSSQPASPIRLTGKLLKLNREAIRESRKQIMIEKLMKVFKTGGIHALDNAECVRPFQSWVLWHHRDAGGDGPWAGTRAHPALGVGRGEPGFVVGVESSVTDSQTGWARGHSRPLTLSELAFASAPAHPILIDMMRRISSGDASESLSNALTDSVIQYLSVMTEGQVHWTDLREIPSEGLRFGDLLILSSQAFSMDVRSRIE